MKVFILATISLFLFSASAAFAVKKTVKIEGMHCKGCVEMMEGEVCEVQKFKLCKAKLTTKNHGQITLETAGKEPIDMKTVKEKVEAAGDYHVIE